MQKYVYACGLCHPVSDLKFVGLESVWSFINFLQSTRRLQKLVCSNPTGGVLDPPYDHSKIPVVFEEEIGNGNVRTWILQIETMADKVRHMVNCMDELFGNRNFYGSDEIAAMLAGHHMINNLEGIAEVIKLHLGITDPEFTNYIIHKTIDYVG